jgi:dihydrofolate reductase
MEEFKNKYTAIACVNTNGVIGKEGKLLYNINGDKKNFRLLTEDNVVIMGRKTFEEIGHPLKNRVNIILTSDENYRFAGLTQENEQEYRDTYICNTIKEADDLCYSLFPDKELFVIGGGEVYEKYFSLELISKAIVTLVSDEMDGDAYFPLVEGSDYRNEFKEIFKTMSLRDHSNDIYYRYIIYKKKC